MNHHGKNPHSDSFGIDELPEFRSTFPVQTHFVFFSCSDLGPNSGLRIGPLPTGRHRAPESVRSRFDLYAADVYQLARFLFAWFNENVPEIPGLLKLLQDMSYFDPRRRISMPAALSRLRSIRAGIQHREMLYTPRELDGSAPSMIPMRHWSWLLDAVRLDQFSFAREYLLKFHLELYRDRVIRLKRMFYVLIFLVLGTLVLLFIQDSSQHGRSSKAHYDFIRRCPQPTCTF
ncbi:hypothetical protein PILCRDRAFT_567117 [Piloderma croceum F 1598]|uniref:Protein kinase domain-containing protein n=1 Tax=Piloderma croceum (strain F 1598) TaxID=765440 RepID=A0A0C3FH21_PILCF|nr:hypothetical protein PILCRDRAFT_758945 [Piloderma croceum F 1598]KIM79096.1 hypothetical protein PILCRDRAFT_567117 [Piloderma croceum F 1598]